MTTEEYSRDQMWEASVETLYEVYYNELETEFVAGRWQRVDDYTRIATAVAAAASGVTGWFLWGRQDLRSLWAIFAGIAACLSLFHVSFWVDHRLQDFEKVRQYFAALRTDLETFIYQMRIHPDFALGGAETDFEKYRKRYREGNEILSNDLLLTRRLREKAQTQVDVRLSDYLEED